MNDRDVEAAQAKVARQTRQLLKAALTMVVLATAAAVCVLLSITLAVALAVTAGLEALVAVGVRYRRTDLIERLALTQEAYSIPAVAHFGSRMCSMRERQKLASWIEGLLEPTGPHAQMYLSDRVGQHAGELRLLARELAVPSVDIRPQQLVACRRLLTRAVQSPLYNPNMPDQDLGAALTRIRSGIRGPAAEGNQASAQSIFAGVP
jgi:hypothetical protein